MGVFFFFKFFCYFFSNLAFTGKHPKTNIMKKAAFILGTTFGSISILGILFKVMHWPGAGIGLVTGVVGFALFALPVIAIYKFNRA